MSLTLPSRRGPCANWRDSLRRLIRARLTLQTALYSLALFTSAALLFVLEPMVGRFVLPLLGSSPTVWTTTVLFFQATLLAAYAYGHLTSRLLSPRSQAAVQLAVLAVAAIALPLSVSRGARPPASSDPVLWLLGLLVATAALPFFALAANGPILQRWLAGRRDPYFLFAASNGGSLLGLLAYPLLVEPLLTVRGQGRAWSWTYATAAILVLACAVPLYLRRGPSRGEPAQSESSTVPWRSRFAWFALAFVPSSLMLGSTTFLTRDLSPIPLLWVAPLALYLLSFVFAFAPRADPARMAAAGRLLLPGAVIVLVYTLAIGSQRPLGLLIALNLLVLALAALMCHARLAAGRPQAGALTEFYLWVAAGGVAGGIFNALIAPVVFPTLIEYPLAIVAACLLRPRPPIKRPAILEFFLRDPRPTQAMDIFVPLLLGGAIAIALELGRGSGGQVPFELRSVVLGLSCGLALNLARRPARFGLGIAAILIAASLAGSPAERVLTRSRSFFGIYKVVASDGDRLHELYDGNTLHGVQRFDGSRPEPSSYYGRAGPAGQALSELPRTATRAVAVIGLGAGSLACYEQPTESWTFFEVDPAVARIAANPRLFTYLSACPGGHRVVLGDGRRSIARARAGSFGMVVIDAFNSDAIPVHLITRQAIELYLARTGGGGPVLFHVSNRYLDLEPVLGNLATGTGLRCLVERHVPSAAEAAAGNSLSKWVIMARGNLQPLESDGRWHPCRRDRSIGIWTDDYSDVVSAISFG
ncbi:MAG: fused MFS/spermidine synthase [Thermoleophilaceae bacterium]